MRRRTTAASLCTLAFFFSSLAFASISRASRRAISAFKVHHHHNHHHQQQQQQQSYTNSCSKITLAAAARMHACMHVRVEARHEIHNNSPVQLLVLLPPSHAQPLLPNVRHTVRDQQRCPVQEPATRFHGSLDLRICNQSKQKYEN